MQHSDKVLNLSMRKLLLRMLLVHKVINHSTYKKTLQHYKRKELV